jgi:hypothetical protein
MVDCSEHAKDICISRSHERQACPKKGSVRDSIVASFYSVNYALSMHHALAVIILCKGILQDVQINACPLTKVNLIQPRTA